MNQSKKCTAIKSLLLLAAWCAGTLAYAAPVVGTVTHLSGPLLAKKADGSIRVLGVKSTIEAGDTLSTQKKVYAQIKLSDDSKIIMRPDTVLTVDSFSFDAAKPQLDNAAYTLVQGGVRLNAGAIAKRSKDRVVLNTPAAKIDLQNASVVVQYRAQDADALAARQAYLLASTAALDVSMQATRSDMPAPAVIQPLMLAQISLPVPGGVKPGSPSAPPALAPGLYVHVIDGLINVSNKGGSQTFAAGQFGFTPNPSQPPVVIPKNPGLLFVPPPAFNISPPSSTGGNNAPGKSNTVDCEVR